MDSCHNNCVRLSRSEHLSVFPVSAGMTNRPDLIDDALMRPGRFEVKMEIGACSFNFSLWADTKTKSYLAFQIKIFRLGLMYDAN